MSAPLASSRRSELRARAHRLRPVVIVGDKGLTPEVLAEIDRSLAAHELIKVKAATDDRAARGAWMEEICARLEAHPVQSIGKVLVIFRARPEPPKPARPRPAEPAPEARAKAGARARRTAPVAGKPAFGRRKPTPVSGKPDSGKRKAAGFGKRKPTPDSGKPDFGKRKPAPVSGKPDFGKRKAAGFGKRKPAPASGPRAFGMAEPNAGERATGSARRRSRTPSSPPASGPRQRRPRTSR